MDFFSVTIDNLLSPAILFFFLGIIAGVIKSDLEVPSSISKYLSIYLMMSIGFKGGYSFLVEKEITSEMSLLIISSICLSLLIPFLGFWLLNTTTKIDKATAAAVASHYGSVSVITFITATSFLKMINFPYKSYVVSILAIMEAPAILSGLYIAHKNMPSTNTHEKEEKKLFREIFTNGSILLIFGSFLIGMITGQSGLDKVKGFLVTPFNGVLCFFLLDMGLIVAKESNHLKKFSISLFMFGIYMPIITFLLGLGICLAIGIDQGTTFLFAVLCASASYIAVPAAMKLALPEAKAGIYIPMSLSISFPFNIIFGIPIYYWIISMFY